jgi:DNA-binding NarL/FixJ family response regulator
MPMGERVLLVDDDDAFREQLAVLLRRVAPDAVVVASVADGHSAVAAAMKHAPTIVLIDYGMPGPTGAHAATVIRQALPQARVVIVSGADQSELAAVPDEFEVVQKGAGLEEALLAALHR